MNCYLCNSPVDDNTHIILPIDNGKHIDIYLCGEHSDTSLRKLKERYSQKLVELDDLIKKAKELGFDIDIGNLNDQNKPKILMATTYEEKGQEKASTANTQLVNYPISPDEDMISTELIDNKTMRSVGGSTDMAQVSSYQSYNIGSMADKLPDNIRAGRVKMAMMEGRAGQPIAIPQKRQDGLGETHIAIVKSENDDKLQTRFKKLASDSIRDRQANFSQSGYTETTRNCPICGGGGTVKQGKNVASCPKCGGAGMISIS
jgi:hypothetical protein